MQNSRLDRLRKQFGDVIGDGVAGIKAAPMKTPQVDHENRLVKGMVTTTDVDMDSEVVLPNFDTSYFPDSVKAVYLDHQYEVPGTVAAVGVCRNFSVRPNGAYAVTYIRKTGLGDDILAAIDCGALGGQSIGFRVLESSEPTTDELAEYGAEVKSVVRHSKLLEFSLVSMPCNSGAMLDLEKMVADGQIRRKSAVLMGLPTTPDRKFFDTGRPRGRSVKMLNGVTLY